MIEAQTLKMALGEARANRASFWSQIGIMATNDLMWVVFWILFFDEVGTLRGWDRDGVLILFSILATSAGLVLGLLANCRRVAALVRTGALDAALTLPVHPLRHLLFRRVEVINLGDVLFGVTVFAVVARPDAVDVAVFCIAVLTSAATATGFMLAVSSLCLFGVGEDTSGLGVSALLVLSNYPIDIFGGAVRVIVFTVVPAAFVSAVPARLVLEPSTAAVAVLVVVAATFIVLGVGVFHAGMARYTSSSVFTRA